MQKQKTLVAHLKSIRSELFENMCDANNFQHVSAKQYGSKIAINIELLRDLNKDIDTLETCQNDGSINIGIDTKFEKIMERATEIFTKAMQSIEEAREEYENKRREKRRAERKEQSDSEEYMLGMTPALRIGQISDTVKSLMDYRSKIISKIKEPVGGEDQMKTVIHELSQLRSVNEAIYTAQEMEHFSFYNAGADAVVDNLPE